MKDGDYQICDVRPFILYQKQDGLLKLQGTLETEQQVQDFVAEKKLVLDETIRDCPGPTRNYRAE